jgi:hypothetical protein
LKWSLGGPLSKLCLTPPFSINFRCQIENQVSDYRLLGASSFSFSRFISIMQMKIILIKKNHINIFFIKFSQIGPKWSLVVHFQNCVWSQPSI